MQNPYSTIFFQAPFFEIEDPSIFNPNLSISITKNQENQISFLQFEDDFVDNTKSDSPPVQPNFHSEENYFLDNTTPQYLQSVIGLDNGTVIQNGLVAKLNNILLNLMLGEKTSDRNIEKTIQYENITKIEKENKIKALENMLNSLNIILMKLSKENKKLKDNIKELIEVVNASNSKNNNENGTNSTINYQKNNETASAIENLTNLIGNLSNSLNISTGGTIYELIKEQIGRKFSNGTKITTNLSSFNLTKNEIAKIDINFTCLKSGLSKIRIYFVPQNEFNPFNSVKLYNNFKFIKYYFIRFT